MNDIMRTIRDHLKVDDATAVKVYDSMHGTDFSEQSLESILRDAAEAYAELQMYEKETTVWLADATDPWAERHEPEDVSATPVVVLMALYPDGFPDGMRLKTLSTSYRA